MFKDEHFKEGGRETKKDHHKKQQSNEVSSKIPLKNKRSIRVVQVQCSSAPFPPDASQISNSTLQNAEELPIMKE